MYAKWHLLPRQDREYNFFFFFTPELECTAGTEKYIYI